MSTCLLLCARSSPHLHLLLSCKYFTLMMDGAIRCPGEMARPRLWLMNLILTRSGALDGDYRDTATLLLSPTCLILVPRRCYSFVDVVP